MSKNLHDPQAPISNPSDNPRFGDILVTRLSRRQLLQTGLASVIAGVLPACAVKQVRHAREPLGFTPIAPSPEDMLRVPAGYEAQVLFRWGDPVGAPEGSPEFRFDASNTAGEQALQAGMHHDGMHFYSLPFGSNNSGHGLLAINHEYLDDGLLHTDGVNTWTPQKVQKAQHAVGVSVIEVRRVEDRWQLVRPSRYARRITARTPCAISGPAAGNELMRTAFDPTGREALGTYNGCAHGFTPWGTFLSCEENWNFHFANPGPISADQKRYGLTAKGRGYRWEEFDERFNAARHPNESNRFGWVVEIDPYDPNAKPIKRTALGRIKHEGACPAIAADRRIAFYMGDDEAFEYIYKFVTRDPYDPSDRRKNRDLLDHGVLYVARFNADGSGEWLPLEFGKGGLGADNGFRDQAEVLVKTRQAADALGATKMDRPEWTAVDPFTGAVYCTLTHNVERGREDRDGANAANPRVNNRFGHIIRWREDNDDFAATRFKWEVFVLAGLGESADESKRGQFKGDAFACPDGLAIDPRGVLWVQTDISPAALNQGDFAPFGNNQMLAVDPVSGAFKRFLTGPVGCEITAMEFTPDGRTAFVNIQHPGEVGGERNDPDNPRKHSNWPDFRPDGRPRSATVTIRKKDGGVVGS